MVFQLLWWMCSKRWHCCTVVWLDYYTQSMCWWYKAYVKAVNILAVQEEFAKNDTSLQNPIFNICDKGYHLTHDASSHGRQYTLQPTFAQSDRRFNSGDVLCSAGVATVHSGNKQSVHHVKLSWLIQKGCSIQVNTNLAMLSDIWLAWGFHINFMYDAVH